MNEKNPHVGSTFESLLREDGIYEEVREQAIKSVHEYRMAKALEENNLSKAHTA